MNIIHCLILVLFLFSSNANAFFGRVDFTVEDDFSDASVRRGVKATEQQCSAASGQTVWVKLDNDLQECIKYWGAGLSPNTNRAVVFLHGDQTPTSPSYLKLSGKALQEAAENWSKRLNAPYIFIGRPGTHGSSGDHSKRRTLEEALILSGTLNVLSERYGIKEFVLSGQSGGGHMTSSLLTLRTDVVCAVPASGPNSPKIRYLRMGRKMDTTNRESYEPVEHLANNAMSKHLRVFILGDPNDANVFWESQIVIAEPLKKRNVEVEIVEGVGLGTERHGLNNSARYLAGLCYHNQPTEEIIQYLRLKNIKG